ncbi:hypothetical protein ElyMa_005633200 [Elysia marginata]|uniref:Uncharacterized protein n=1 Tax=Elysia marginata TaxID=1093978 RepID=A0AAV4F961_9GAST|nr:hypothetical protein ElyMa_005633200 [Elysia marginata]
MKELRSKKRLGESERLLNEAIIVTDAQGQRTSESAAQRAVRKATEVFGPRGDEQVGVQAEWLAYCDSLEIMSKFTSFNNVFENAEAFIHHKQHIN